MNKMVEFSRATGLHVNPDKCKVYLGGIDRCVKTDILRITSFSEGELPLSII